MSYKKLYATILDIRHRGFILYTVDPYLYISDSSKFATSVPLYGLLTVFIYQKLVKYGRTTVFKESLGAL